MIDKGLVAWHENHIIWVAGLIMRRIGVVDLAA